MRNGLYQGVNLIASYYLQRQVEFALEQWWQTFETQCLEQRTSIHQCRATTILERMPCPVWFSEVQRQHKNEVCTWVVFGSFRNQVISGPSKNEFVLLVLHCFNWQKLQNSKFPVQISVHWQFVQYYFIIFIYIIHSTIHDWIVLF